jgi:hypothetical protein
MCPIPPQRDPAMAGPLDDLPALLTNLLGDPPMGILYNKNAVASMFFREYYPTLHGGGEQSPGIHRQPGKLPCHR